MKQEKRNKWKDPAFARRCIGKACGKYYGSYDPLMRKWLRTKANVLLVKGITK